MITLSFPFTSQDRKRIRKTILEQDGTVVFPTETFYALGCAATSSVAVNKIYSLKERNKDQPLLVLVNDWSMLQCYAAAIPKKHATLLKHHWPGPLTAVLHTKDLLAKELNYHDNTLGFRCTSSPVALELIKILNLPLVGTSANKTKEKESGSCQEAESTFGDAVDLYIDGGPSMARQPSTLVDLTTDQPKIIRQGAIRLPPDIIR